MCLQHTSSVPDSSKQSRSTRKKKALQRTFLHPGGAGSHIFAVVARTQRQEVRGEGSECEVPQQRQPKALHPAHRVDHQWWRCLLPFCTRHKVSKTP